MKHECACGCARRAVHRHHVVSRQELKRHATGRQLAALLRDERNLVWLAFDCHLTGQENARRRLPLGVLPDAAVAFAAEVLGVAAYDYLRRFYVGTDARVEALLNLPVPERAPVGQRYWPE